MNQDPLALVCMVICSVLRISSRTFERSTTLVSLGIGKPEIETILQELHNVHGVLKPSDPRSLETQLNQRTVSGLCNYVLCRRGVNMAKEPPYREPRSNPPRCVI